MTYKIVIPIKKKRDGKWNKVPSLNDFIKAERTTIYTKNGKFLTKGAVMKKEWQKYMANYICDCMGKVKIKEPMIMHYHFYEADHRRDWSNCFSTFVKFFEDSLQECGVILNDNQRFIKGFTAEFEVDGVNPRTEIEIEVLENEWGFNPYQE